MSKGKHLGLILLATLLLSACHKEGVGRLELLLEPMGDPAAKLAVSQDSMAVWSNGDMINFNDVPTEVRREGEHAYIDATSSQTVNRACYPAGIVAAFSGGDEVIVTLPAAYHYRIDSNGVQLVDMPLAARGGEDSPLMFKHLTAAVCVKLTNNKTSGQALVIDSISITSDAYRLSGDYPLNLNAIESFGAQVLGGGGSDNRVTMFFDRQRLEIPYGESRKVLIPVPPVGSTNHFTITVAARYQGKRYNYSISQPAGGALDRKVLAYAPITLNEVTNTTLFVGTGKTDEPFQIKNVTDWIAMTEAINNNWYNYKYYNAACYKLMNSIDMKGIIASPIVGYSNARFDGNDKTISNITIEGTGDKMGLFSSMEKVRVSNLTLSNVMVRHTGSPSYLYLGAFAGEMTTSKLQKCIVDGFSVSVANTISNVYFGGVAGHTLGSDTLDQCTVNYTQTLTINSTSGLFYGGLVGYCEKNANTTYLPVTNCTVTNSPLQLTTNKTLRAGGLLGYTSNVIVTFENSSWTGSMAFIGSGTPTVGKLIGAYYVGSGGSLAITNTTATGSVTANGNECTQNVGNNPAY